MVITIFQTLLSYQRYLINPFLTAYQVASLSILKKRKLGIGKGKKRKNGIKFKNYFLRKERGGIYIHRSPPPTFSIPSLFFLFFFRYPVNCRLQVDLLKIKRDHFYETQCTSMAYPLLLCMHSILEFITHKDYTCSSQNKILDKIKYIFKKFLRKVFFFYFIQGFFCEAGYGAIMTHSRP